MTEEDIKNYLNTDDDRQVLSIRRMKRRVIPQSPETQIKYENTNTIIAVFRGSTPPKVVKLFFNIRYPEIYVGSVIQCHKCARYGHTSKICKSKARCPACSNEHELAQCTERDTPKCVHCKGSHLSNEKGTPTSERICQEYLKQKKIKHLMAVYNITFFEAMREISGNRPTTINRIRDEHQYPSLPKHDSNYDKIPAKMYDYNKVVQNNEKKNFTFTKTISQRTNTVTPKRKQGVPSELLFYHDGSLPEYRGKRTCPTNQESVETDKSLDTPMELALDSDVFYENSQHNINQNSGQHISNVQLANTISHHNYSNYNAAGVSENNVME